MKTENKKINILDLRDSPWVDGPGRTILDCAQSIEGDRFHFIIGSFSGGKQNTNEYAEDARRRGLEVVSIPEKSSFDWSVIPFILKLIKEHDIDIVHTHDFRSDLFGLIAAKRSRKCVVSTVHGWIANSTKGRIYIIIDKVILRFFDHIIAVSERTRGLLTKFNIPGKKTSVINNALKIEQYQINRSDKGFRTELSIKDDEILVANIGRLSPEKGQVPFLMAARELLQKDKKFKFVLIGIGPHEEMLKQYVRDNGLDDNVIFAGFRKDMVRVYNSIDLIVQSSFTEGMPNVILEALLMSLPVIATDVGGTAEIVRHNENGILIQPDSVESLIKEIINYRNNRERHMEMAQKGRKLIEEQFNHDRRVETFIAMYSKLADSREL